MGRGKLGWSALALVAMVIAAMVLEEVDGERSRGIPGRTKRQRSKKPNIVLILTDDQDVLLGSIKVMPKTRRLLRDQGAELNNTFTSTPMCCPSRSSILTGLYTHNHNVYTNNDNCSSPQWQRTHETRTFATYLDREGYNTGYFGKYLNEYNGTYIPPGWREWVGLIRNSRFYNYSLNFNGQTIRHYDNYYKDYLTDLVANDSVTFLKQSKQYFPDKPVLMVLSVPAPHGPEDAAPQYQHMFANNTDHHTPNYNVAPNADKQWLLQVTEKMTPIFKKFTDLLQRRRLQTLLSVDDLVEKVITELNMLGELDNTYVLYTSDHGYHLGQFGLVKGKAMSYDFDTRIPFFIRGPGIRPRTKIANIVGNIDIAPTILDMAGVAVPSSMDGASVLPLLERAANPNNVDSGYFVRPDRLWRDTYLLERGKVTMKQLKAQLDQENREFWQKGSYDDKRRFFMTRKWRRLASMCAHKKRQRPCKPNQKMYCQRDRKGRPRILRCPDPPMEEENSLQADQSTRCQCPESSSVPRQRHRRDRKRQRKSKRHGYNLRLKYDRQRRSLAFNNHIILSPGNQPMQRLQLFQHRCRVLLNNTIMCDEQLSTDLQAWQDHKERVDAKIKEYRKALEDLRDIRRHLKQLKPDMEIPYHRVYPQDRLLPQPSQQENSVLDPDCNCDPKLQTDLFNPENSSSNNQDKYKRKKNVRRRRRRKDKGKGCQTPNMKCFHHDNNHWQTPPLWNTSGTGKKLRRLNHPMCRLPGLECTFMDNHHWITPPLWTNGPFCFCPNSNNNTYWCLRTINQTHDFLYCEFITNFISYFDHKTDPFQLKNVVKSLNYGVLQQLHDQLNIMRQCRGQGCTTRAGLRVPLPEEDNDLDLWSGDGDEDEEGDAEEIRMLPAWEEDPETGVYF